MVRPEYGISYPWGKPEVTEIIEPLLPSRAHILDIGAGAGVYREYIGRKHYWTAIESWPPTAEYLRGVYDEVYECDIRDFEYKKKYDLIIFGDVLEHLTVDDAKYELARAMQWSDLILVAVPYRLPQDAIHGNEAEIHRQPDLTIGIMSERYPQLKPIHIVKQGNHLVYGYYLYKGEE